MKVLHVISSSDSEGGGPIEWVRQCSVAMAEAGHQPEVVTLNSPGARGCLGDNIPVHALGPGMGLYRYAPHAVSRLGDLAVGRDAVIVHGLWQYCGWMTRKALRGKDVPYYLTPHGMLDPWFKKSFPLKHVKKLLYWPFEYLVLRDAAGVLFTSEEERRLARESFRPYRCREVVCPLGVPRAGADDSRNLRLPSVLLDRLRGRPFLLHMCRMHPIKGGDVLLRAYAQLGNDANAPVLAMVGPDIGGWRAELQQIARAEGVADRVVWLDFASGDTKTALLDQAQAFVLPSREDTFPLSVLESLASGTPVLISKGVRIWREIEQAGAGIVAKGDVRGMSQLLRRWIELSPAEKGVAANRASDLFDKQYELHSAVRKLLNVIEAGVNPRVSVAGVGAAPDR